jgi:hypothetical protein
MHNRRRRQEKTTLCRKLVTAKKETKPWPPDSPVTSQPQPKPVERCPLCKVGRMNPVEILFPQASVIVRSCCPFLNAMLEWNSA